MNEFQQTEHNDYCLDESTLVAHRDGALTADEETHINAHLAECAGCATHEQSIIHNGHEIYDALALLAPQESEIPQPAAALARLQKRLREDEQAVAQPATLNVLTSNVVRRRAWYRRPRTWVATVAAAVILAIILLPNAGALADQFLALFRVQQFQPVTISPQDLRTQQMPGLQYFGTVQNTGGDMTGNVTEARAEQLVHFHILLPGYLPNGVGGQPTFSVMTGAQVTFTFSAKLTRAYLDKNGGQNIAIPANLDGAVFTISVSPGVEIQYGNSDSSGRGLIGTVRHSAASSATGPNNQNSQDTSGSNYTTPFIIAEVPSPTIRATGGATLNELRDFLLKMPNLPPSLVSQLKNIDLNSGTIPIPVPPQITAQHITVHGAQGLLLADSTPIGGIVVWQTHDMIYGVGGAAGNADQLMETANSLH